MPTQPTLLLPPPRLTPMLPLPLPLPLPLRRSPRLAAR